MKRKKIVALLCAMATSSSLVMPVMAADPAAEVQTQETTTETSDQNITESTGSEDAVATEEMLAEENQDNPEETENTQNAEQNDQSEIVSEQQVTDSDEEVPTDGLYQDDQGNWYYYENGTMIQNQIVDFEDSETGESYSCFFQDNGIMLISDNLFWIEYPDENGENVCGYICTDENGHLRKNQLVDFEDPETGESYSCYFMSNGIMLTNAEHYDIGNYNEDGEYIGGYICIDENGHLQKNIWREETYYGEDENYHKVNTYYGSDGFLVTNKILELDGEKYYFNQEGYLVKNQNILFEGIMYNADQNGKLTLIDTSKKNGWLQTEKNWYYYQNGIMVKNSFCKINNKDYYFDEDGKMQTGIFWVSDDYKRYFAEPSGSVVLNHVGWFKSSETGARYYFDEDSDIICGEFRKINGKTYYFDYDGKLKTGAFEAWDSDTGIEKAFYANEDGVIEEKQGWLQVDADWKYIKEDGTWAKGEFLNISGKTYYFDYDGKMQTGVFEIWDSESQSMKVYYAYTDGSIEQNCKWVVVDSEWKYIKEDRTWAQNEILKISGKTYYFDWNGVMQTGVVCTNDGEYYYARKDGSFVTQEGWISQGEYCYYVKSNGKLARNELVKVGRKTYCFNHDGLMQTGIVSVYDDNNKISSYYYADETGSIVTKKGWFKYEGRWYYAKDSGKLASNEIVESGYYIWYNGQMAVDTFVDTGKTHYYVNSSGKICKNGWINHKVGWSYADKDGNLYTDKWIGNYYVNSYGVTVTGIYEMDGTYYVFDDNGVYQKKIPKNGWQLADGQWFYYNEDGTAYNGWLNDTYYISEGYMMTNSVVNSHSENPKYVGYDGIVRKSWIQDGNSWYYAENDGSLVQNAWKLIGGKWYYFDGIYMVSNTIREIDNVTYLFDANEAEIKSINTIGWIKDNNGHWYWKDKDGLMKNDQKVINGNTYYFDYDGHMYANECAGITIDGHYDEYWFDADGKIDTKDGWKYDGENYYYVLNGKLATGKHIINGKEYYLLPSMVTGILTYNNTLYDASGAKINATNGWYSVVNNGKTEWYYFKNGDPYSGWFGKYYLVNGKMTTGLKYNWLFGLRMFDKDGNLCENKWVLFENKWYYAGAGGRVYTGQRTINGKTYWFDSNGVWVK